MLTDQAFVTSRKTVSVPYRERNPGRQPYLVTIYYHLDSVKIDYKHFFQQFSK